MREPLIASGKPSGVKKRFGLLCVPLPVDVLLLCLHNGELLVFAYLGIGKQQSTEFVETRTNFWCPISCFFAVTDHFIFPSPRASYALQSITLNSTIASIFIIFVAYHDRQYERDGWIV